MRIPVAIASLILTLIAVWNAFETKVEIARDRRARQLIVSNTIHVEVMQRFSFDGGRLL